MRTCVCVDAISKVLVGADDPEPRNGTVRPLKNPTGVNHNTCVMSCRSRMLRAVHSLSAFIKKTVGTTMRDILNLDVDQKAYFVVKS